MLNRNDEQNDAKRMVLFCVAAASVVLLLFLAVLYTHDSKNAKKYAVKDVKETKEIATAKKDEIEVGKTNLVSDDLDFWDMYDEPENEEDDDDAEGLDNKNSLKKNTSSSASLYDKYKKETGNSDDSDAESKNKDADEADDGKHIKVKGSDGNYTWYEILDDVEKNTYRFDNCLSSDNGLLKYDGSDIKSILGMDISNYQGTIDFEKAKNAGIGFVMIKVASRGYESGQVTIDDRFVEYATGATNAGLPIGIYFVSQAITDVEAVEEANFAVAAAANYNVKYPIAIDVSKVLNDKARTDKLTNSERTAIIKKFCDTVKSYGKTPAVCADRDFLIAQTDLTMLSDYDIWLKDEVTEEESTKDDKDEPGKSSSENKSGEDDTEREVKRYIGPDYPYCFTMWQYTKTGTINGVNNKVNLNLSFVNYAER